MPGQRYDTMSPWDSERVISTHRRSFEEKNEYDFFAQCILRLRLQLSKTYVFYAFLSSCDRLKQNKILTSGNFVLLKTCFLRALVHLSSFKANNIGSNNRFWGWGSKLQSPIICKLDRNCKLWPLEALDIAQKFAKP